jgi:hypothetical protein
MPRPCNSSRFYHSNNIGWGVQIIMLLIMWFSLLTCHFVALIAIWRHCLKSLTVHGEYCIRKGKMLQVSLQRDVVCINIHERKDSDFVFMNRIPSPSMILHYRDLSKSLKAMAFFANMWEKRKAV